jgi:hypothetical protein
VGGYAHIETDYACISSASVKDFGVISAGPHEIGDYFQKKEKRRRSYDLQNLSVYPP